MQVTPLGYLGEEFAIYNYIFMIYRFFVSVLLCVVFIGANAQSFSKTHIGAHIGYGVKGHLPIGISLQTNKVFYGFTYSPSISKGVKGESYTGTVNWDEFPEDHVSEGSYKESFTVDLGYFVTDYLAIGGGLGYGYTMNYRNCYDEFNILGNNGSYYIEINKEGWLDAKLFLLYKFPVSSMFNMYVKAGYSKSTTGFCCIGFQI